MAVSRFERKIVAAIAAVALMPLIGALVLGQSVLREAYAVGVNDRVGGEIERGLSLYQTHFNALRADAQRTAQAIVHDAELNRLLSEPGSGQAPQGEANPLSLLLRGLLTRYENVVRIQLLAGERILAAHERPDLDKQALRLLDLELLLAQVPQVRARVTIGTDAKAFGDYQRAGEINEVFRTLKEGSAYVSGFYLAVYIAFLMSVIVVALGIGLTLSRRVTRRVTQLAEATARLGAGDLSVSVPVEEADEVSDLTRSFNDMVRDMRESRARIEYLSRIGAWQEFARRLAHEIKNPLTPIQLAVQELHRSYKGDDARFRRTLEDARAIVEEEIATLRRLVGEFSEFARLPEVRAAPADLGVFVREAVDAPFRGDESLDDEAISVEVVAEIESGALPVQIDGMLLKRCLDNLIRNAAQALRGAGTPEGRVVVAARADGDHAILEVRDNGPGVPEDVRERIFDPYYTTKNEGTGLGLAIVKKIVLEHGGEIDCREAAEGGACLQIRLPMSRNSRLGAEGRISRVGGEA
jgi:nitrogen fixation/metabolism regulation signal transduction histidine kinase